MPVAPVREGRNEGRGKGASVKNRPASTLLKAGFQQTGRQAGLPATEYRTASLAIATAVV